jgi:hypothetical protein
MPRCRHDRRRPDCRTLSVEAAGPRRLGRNRQSGSKVRRVWLQRRIHDRKRQRAGGRYFRESGSSAKTARYHPPEDDAPRALRRQYALSLGSCRGERSVCCCRRNRAGSAECPTLGADGKPEVLWRQDHRRTAVLGGGPPPARRDLHTGRHLVPRGKSQRAVTRHGMDRDTRRSPSGNEALRRPGRCWCRCDD